jgi:glutathione-regulated potassium-efflux system ancillary protein KefG
MLKAVVLCANPLFEKSLVHHQLSVALKEVDHISWIDLYELYPDFDINIKKEQKRLEAFDVIIFQHPIYWYSCPPLLKQYIDLVFEYDWAYGKKGNALKDKYFFQIISTGGTKEGYCSSGKDGFTIRELLQPFHQTAMTCKMIPLPPFVVHGARKINEIELQSISQQLQKVLLKLLENNFKSKDFNQCQYLNEIAE